MKSTILKTIALSLLSFATLTAWASPPIYQTPCKKTPTGTYCPITVANTGLVPGVITVPGSSIVAPLSSGAHKTIIVKLVADPDGITTVNLLNNNALDGCSYGFKPMGTPVHAGVYSFHGAGSHGVVSCGFISEGSFIFANLALASAKH